VSRFPIRINHISIFVEPKASKQAQNHAPISPNRATIFAESPDINFESIWILSYAL